MPKPGSPEARKKRVAQAKEKIKQLVYGGVTMNPKKASASTLQHMANAPASPNRAVSKAEIGDRLSGQKFDNQAVSAPVKKKKKKSAQMRKTESAIRMFIKKSGT